MKNIFLLGLGIIYLGVDNSFDNLVVDDQDYTLIVDAYSEYLDKKAKLIEEQITRRKISYDKLKIAENDVPGRIVNFYNGIKDEAIDNHFQRLVDAIVLLQPEFISNNNNLPIGEIGESLLDSKLLYCSFLNSYSFGTWPNISCALSTRTDFDYYSEMYITKLVQPDLNDNYLLIYDHVEYALNNEQVNIHFSQEDVDRGFGNIQIREIFTGAETTATIKLPSYAFNY